MIVLLLMIDGTKVQIIVDYIKVAGGKIQNNTVVLLILMVFL
jgi:hypothetical protein